MEMSGIAFEEELKRNAMRLSDDARDLFENTVMSFIESTLKGDDIYSAKEMEIKNDGVDERIAIREMLDELMRMICKEKKRGVFDSTHVFSHAGIENGRIVFSYSAGMANYLYNKCFNRKWVK